MPSCCGGEGYDAVFGDGFARRRARRYRKHGLNDTALRMVDFLAGQGIDGASVLEIGGGVGEIQLELLRRGAAHATNLEISSSYEDEARQLIERDGMTGRVSRRLHDIAQDPESVEPTDIVVLHRVVCCYPDYERLLAAAAGRAGRTLVFSHPPDHVLTRAALWVENSYLRLRGRSFRAFVHPPDAMLSVLADAGLTARYRHRGSAWCVVGLER